MTDSDHHSESIPEPVDVAGAEGQEKVETVASPSDVLNKINAATGRNYADLDTALRAVGDTYKYVGQPKPEVSASPEVESRIRSMEEELFYSQNPEYRDYRGVIAKMGQSPSEVVASEEFKTIFAKAKGYDESQSVKSVLHSNPKLGIVKDKMGDAREKLTAAYQAPDSVTAQRLVGEAENSAVGAVIESFDLK